MVAEIDKLLAAKNAIARPTRRLCALQIGPVPCSGNYRSLEQDMATLMSVTPESLVQSSGGDFTFQPMTIVDPGARRSVARGPWFGQWFWGCGRALAVARARAVGADGPLIGCAAHRIQWGDGSNGRLMDPMGGSLDQKGRSSDPMRRSASSMAALRYRCVVIWLRCVGLRVRCGVRPRRRAYTLAGMGADGESGRRGWRTS